MPPLTLENASALVPGGGASAHNKETSMIAQKQAQVPQTQKVQVLRAFYFKGEVQAVKSTLTLPRAFALEMAAANKVQFVVEDEAAKPELPAGQQESRPAKKEVRNA